jgi:hypothetical protein
VATINMMRLIIHPSSLRMCLLVKRRMRQVGTG